MCFFLVSAIFIRGKCPFLEDALKNNHWDEWRSIVPASSFGDKKTFGFGTKHSSCLFYLLLFLSFASWKGFVITFALSFHFRFVVFFRFVCEWEGRALFVCTHVAPCYRKQFALVVKVCLYPRFLKDEWEQSTLGQCAPLYDPTFFFAYFFKKNPLELTNKSTG